MTTRNGGKGRDTYDFEIGDGAVTAVNAGGDGAAQDTVKFGSRIAFDRLWFERSGDDLKVSILGTDDSVTVKEWYDGMTTQRVGFEFSGNSQHLAQTDVQKLVNAMAAMTQPTGADATEWTKTQQEHTTLASFVAAHGSTVTS